MATRRPGPKRPAARVPAHVDDSDHRIIEVVKKHKGLIAHGMKDILDKNKSSEDVRKKADQLCELVKDNASDATFITKCMDLLSDVNKEVNDRISMLEKRTALSEQDEAMLVARQMAFDIPTYLYRILFNCIDPSPYMHQRSYTFADIDAYMQYLVDPQLSDRQTKYADLKTAILSKWGLRIANMDEGWRSMLCSLKEIKDGCFPVAHPNVSTEKWDEMKQSTVGVLKTVMSERRVAGIEAAIKSVHMLKVEYEKLNPTRAK